MKKCSSCQQILPLTNFYKRKDRKLGIQSICKTCDKKRCLLWRQKNKQKWIEYSRLYRRTYKKIRKQLDPKYHLDEIMGNAIYVAIKRQKQGQKWEEFVNYNVNDLINHLENLFESWMNWNNWGIYNPIKKTWQIDHIKPKNQFNYISYTDSEFKKCWALNNLRPLETIKNLKKPKFNKGENNE